MNSDGIIWLYLPEVRENPRNPYRVVSDDTMDELIESIREHGVLNPGLARPMPKGGYEIVSGHRRRYACECNGMDEMPFIVREMDDDEAAIAMVDSNFQRTKLLMSEKAWAYRIRLEAMKRKAGRPSNNSQLPNSYQADTNLAGKRSDAELAEQSPDSSAQIHRYIRLTYLIPGLMKKVDLPDPHESISFGVGVNLSYLTKEEQTMLDWIITTTYVPRITIEQSKKMSELSAKRELSKAAIEDILSDGRAPRKPRFWLREQQVLKYFPADTTHEQAWKTIEEMLVNYKRRWTRAGTK